MDVNKVLPERLKQCRKEKGLKQWQVAVYCDITEKAYQNYELMAREPRLEILVKLADLFDVSLDYLTGRSTYKRGTADPTDGGHKPSPSGEGGRRSRSDEGPYSANAAVSLSTSPPPSAEPPLKGKP